IRELLSLLFCFFKASLSGRYNLALENLALRRQLPILKRTRKRPAIRQARYGHWLVSQSLSSLLKSLKKFAANSDFPICPLDRRPQLRRVERRAQPSRGG